jgi:DNA repair exonuclease SbcCD ATPase subunit
VPTLKPVSLLRCPPSLARLFSGWRLATLQQQLRNSQDKLHSLNALLSELRENEARVLQLESVWKQELDKKDERLLLFEQRLEELSYEIVQKDLRYEKLRVVYGEAVGEIGDRERELRGVVQRVLQS